MDTTAWISLAAISISGFSLFGHRLTRRKPRHDASDDLVHGDCPLIPDDLKRNHARFTSTEGQRHAAHR